MKKNIEFALLPLEIEMHWALLLKLRKKGNVYLHTGMPKHNGIRYKKLLIVSSKAKYHAAKISMLQKRYRMLSKIYA